MPHEMERLADEPYKDRPGSEHGIYQTYKLALHQYALLKLSSMHYYGEENNLFRSQGPDGGFHTGYDQQGTYAGTLENAETTSIIVIGATFPLPQDAVTPSIALPRSSLFHHGSSACSPD